MDKKIENNLKSKTILVTGASGFIGRNLVNELTKQKFKVIALIRNENKIKKIHSLQNVDKILFNLEDRRHKLIFPKNSILIHCAWNNVRKVNCLSHIEKSFPDNYFFLKYALEHGVSKIIILGSCQEYGNVEGSVSANTKPVPYTSYATAKDLLHKSLKVLKNNIHFDMLWLRLFYMYGDGQQSDCIIPLLDKALEKGDNIFNMSPGDQQLDFLHINQVVKKIILKIKCKSGTYNICDGKPTVLKDLLEKRMKEKGKFIKLNLGYYRYRKNESKKLWGLSE